MKKLAYGMVAVQLAASAVLTLESASRSGRNMVLLFCLSLLSAQAGLLGSWAALARWTLAWRIAALASGGALLATQVCLAANVSAGASLLAAFMPIACLFAFQSARRARASFLLLEPAELKRSTPAQFTISQIFALTAAVAVVSALFRVVTWPRRALVDIAVDDYVLDIVTFSLCAIPVSIVCSWAAFSFRWSLSHWLAILLAPIAAGLFPMLYRGGPDAWVFAIVCLVQEAAAASALAPLRFHGYRFVANRRAA